MVPDTHSAGQAQSKERNEPISVLINLLTLLTQCLLSTLLVLTLTMHELRHWPFIAGMSPQSHCGNRDGCIGLSSWFHYMCITLLALSLLSTLCVMSDFCFNLCFIYIYIYILDTFFAKHFLLSFSSRKQFLGKWLLLPLWGCSTDNFWSVIFSLFL